MRILVTGSAGHLGEGLMRTFEQSAHEAIGMDIKASPFTHQVGSITDRAFVKECMQGVETVLHTATLHKPHVATHSREDFVDTNITGTLNLLEEAVQANVGVFLYTSTTSTFGRALTPDAAAPAAWITENVVPIPKNIYGVTKVAAESLCESLVVYFEWRDVRPVLEHLEQAVKTRTRNSDFKERETGIESATSRVENQSSRTDGLAGRTLIFMTFRDRS